MHTPAPVLPEHYFRHAFGRLVSVLSRRFGVHRMELCEDAAQTALLRGVHGWPERGLPDDPDAWLYRVALNEVLGTLRREKRREPPGAVGSPTEEPASAEPGPDAGAFLEHEVKDDQLRLLFVCADPSIPRESQLVLSLKTLCGFSTDEIALRLFQSPDAIHKRLQRARAALREDAVELDTPDLEQLATRLPAVLHMLYLLFSEGYSSAQPDRLIRQELCEEALRLAQLLIEHPACDVPEAHALLSLMCLDAARFDARTDGAGGLLLLEEQDRSRWDRRLIEVGIAHLARAARGVRFSRYHAEAAIAAEHCLAPSYGETRWEEIVHLYGMLDGVAPSPINTLNRAIAIAEWRGPDAGLRLLETLEAPRWLLGFYLWDATLGELHRRAGHLDRAKTHLTRALHAAPTHAEQALIARRLQACSQA